MRDHYRRNQVRYPRYDYGQPGSVFVTICTSGRQPLFGVVTDEMVSLSPVGQMVHDAWNRVPDRFPGVLLDEWIVMPDHLHAVLMIGADPASPFSTATVSDVVRWFKSSTVAAFPRV